MRTELEQRCLDFGIATIKWVRTIDDGLTKRTREQFVSSATSIGANVAEARSAQSHADFIHKMELALKEARETDYWLNVLRGIADEPSDTLITLIGECDEITAMLVASVLTAKGNRNNPRAEVRMQNLRQSAEVTAHLVKTPAQKSECRSEVRSQK